MVKGQTNYVWNCGKTYAALTMWPEEMSRLLEDNVNQEILDRDISYVCHIPEDHIHDWKQVEDDSVELLPGTILHRCQNPITLISGDKAKAAILD